MSEPKVLTVEESEITPCRWNASVLSRHQWHDTVDGYQRCANCKHVRQKPTPVPREETLEYALGEAKEFIENLQLPGEEWARVLDICVNALGERNSK